MASNREDFLDNDLIQQLKDIIVLSIEWMTLQYSHYKARKAQEELQEETEKFLEETGDDDDSGSETGSGGEAESGAKHNWET